MQNFKYSYYYEGGMIKRDPFGMLGYEKLEDLLDYIKWCVD